MGLLLIWDDIHRHAGGIPVTTVTRRRTPQRSRTAREQERELIQKNWFSENWLIEVSGDSIYNRIEKTIDTKPNVLVKIVEDKTKITDYEKDIKVSVNSVRVNDE